MSLLSGEQLQRGTLNIILLSVWLCNWGGVRCEECADGIYKDDFGFCLCTDGTCSKCVQEYYVKYYGQKLYCAECNNNCLSCSNWTICDECRPHFEGYMCDMCSTGYYGEECNIRCSNGCQKGDCRKESGQCDCKTNFVGHQCNSCITGFHGDDCQAKCSLRCQFRSCKKDTGNCQFKPNFTGNNCATCLDSFYGTECNFSCSYGCRGGNCNTDTGTCTCAPNFTGSKCESCLNGKYGTYCNTNCSVGCLDTCHSNNGKCQCKPNYIGDLCNTCKEGWYGKYCNLSCSQNCISCSDKYHCVSCKPGFYGKDCHNPCPTNCETCDQSGSCLACKSGFTRHDKKCQCIESLCDTTACLNCTNSSYYVDDRTCCPCNSRCKYAACKSASECLNGCEDGFFGAKCEFNCTRHDGRCSICNGESSLAFKCSKCNTGFYPNTFGKCTRCSTSCLNGECNSLNGRCERGCTEAYWNTTCERRCRDNCSKCDQNTGVCLVCSTPSLYGGECNLNCNNNCIYKSCHINGSCTSGCIVNYFGQSCDTPCPSKCALNGSESRCFHETGLCSFGCSAGFTGDNCIETLMKDRNEDTVPAVVIGGVGAAVVIFAIVIAFGVFINLRRRNREPTTQLVHEQSSNEDNASAPVYATVACSGKQDNTGMVYANTSSVEVYTATGHDIVYTNDARHLTIVTTEESLEIDELDYIARQNALRFEENGGVYYNNDNKVRTYKIPVEELEKFVTSKNFNYFITEFEKLPYGLLRDYTVSQMKANIAKNRYKGIYPYDDRRVRVLGGDTDYINASFIDGYKRRNEYIATLGPMSKQLGDFSAFWRMVWQQKVEKIVMVTNLVEKGIDKCEQYWPNEGSSQMFGDVRVLCQSENHYAEFTRRTFTIEKEEEERALIHFHFTSWPDKDVPDDVTSIIDFRYKVLQATSVLGGPTIVHCSAGIGRTGSYIAIDILTKEGESEREVDIAGCVLNMRQNRPNMVQTAGQYEYLHHAVAHALTFDSKPVALERFQTYMNTTSKEQIKNIFHQLQETKTSGSLDETTAVERNTKFSNKNRKGSDIPGDVHRPRLYLNQKPGSSDYINAVFVNSFQTKNKYIIAQTPLPNTVADFLALIVQTDCACIVSFESTSATEKDIGVYVPPENQVLKKGIFNVICSKPEANAYRVKRKLTIEHQGKVIELCLTHIEFTDWKTDENIPNLPSDYRRLIAEVNGVTAQTNADRPVLIHCLDGASKCALFSVVAPLLQTIEVEHEVSIVNAVRKVRSRRKGAIPNAEQFLICHDCVLDYIKSSNAFS